MARADVGNKGGGGTNVKENLGALTLRLKTWPNPGGERAIEYIKAFYFPQKIYLIETWKTYQNLQTHTGMVVTSAIYGFLGIYATLKKWVIIRE